MSGPDLGLPHRFLPAGDPSEGRTLLALHGTGGDENSLLELAITMLPGAAVLAPRGRVREGGANRWFRRLAEGVFDEDDLRERAAELADFVAAACRAYDLNPDRVIAVGYSNGANMASATLMLHPEALRGALVLRGMLPLRPAPLPDLTGRDALIVSGADDPFGPLDSATDLARLLAESNARVRHEVLPVGHGLVTPDVDLGRQWLRSLS